MTPTPSDLTLALWAFAEVAQEFLAVVGIVVSTAVLGLLAYRATAEGQQATQGQTDADAAPNLGAQLQHATGDRAFRAGGRGL